MTTQNKDPWPTRRARAIRAAYDLGEFDYAELGRLFGCDGATIAGILDETEGMLVAARRAAPAAGGDVPETAEDAPAGR